MKKTPTIRDVAELSGTSVSVVSRVLNEGSGPVAPNTRNKVLEAIEELAYRPRAAARSLSSGQTTTIGLLLADLTNPFFARLADRIVGEARSRDVQVVLMTTGEDSNLEADSLKALLDRSVGGVIATPTGANVEQWEKLQKIGVDLVFVDRSVDTLENADVVSIENSKSAGDATEYLLGLGHKRIALITGPLSTSTGRSRLSGYELALKKGGIKFDPNLVRNVPFRGDGGGDAIASLLSMADRPTAAIVANTAQVANVYRRLTQMSVSIPDELSLIVFDDNPWVQLVSPPLSSINQPIDMLAFHSVDLLINRMNGKLPNGRRYVEVQAEFSARNSCAAPRNRK